MKKTLAALFALIGWFAVITQFVLMVNNRAASVPETIIRFFSFFTILTNILVALYFTVLAVAKKDSVTFVSRPGTLTAIAIYITTVGVVYQVVLRHVWRPTGMQLIVDELLHTIIPVLVIIFWFLYENVKPIKYKQITAWLLYPLLYLGCILIRGSFLSYYPYPFIDVTALGMTKALTNAAVLLIAFIIVSALFIFIGKTFIKR